MIIVRIGSDERPLEEASESWICEQVGRLRENEVAFCVEVRIQTSNVDIVLRTPACGGGAVGGRPSTPEERRVIDLWDKLHLNTNGFGGGNLIAFLKQVDRL